MQVKLVLFFVLLLLVAIGKSQEVASANSGDERGRENSDKKEKYLSEMTNEKYFTFTYFPPDKEQLSLPVRESVEAFWGGDIARYYALFEHLYVYEEKPVAGDPNVIVRYRKPRIYKSIKGLESYLRKEIKKGNCSQAVASSQLKKILQVGIAAISEESKSFEEELKSLKSKKDQIKIYSKIILNKI